MIGTHPKEAAMLKSYATKSKLKKICRQDYIKSQKRFTLRPNSATEIGLYIVRWNFEK